MCLSSHTVTRQLEPELPTTENISLFCLTTPPLRRIANALLCRSLLLMTSSQRCHPYIVNSQAQHDYHGGQPDGGEQCGDLTDVPVVRIWVRVV